MESHPDFQKIIEAVINKRITGREASKRLGTTEPNFSQYMSRHYPKHKPTRKKRVKRKDPLAISIDKEGEPVLNVQLSANQSNLEWGTVAWKKMTQNLVSTLTTEPNLDLNEQLKLSRTLMDLLKFQFSHNVPDIPQETVHLDEEMVKEIVDKVMADHDTWCKYRTEFIQRKDRSQSKSRLESPEPPLVEWSHYVETFMNCTLDIMRNG